MLARYKDYDTRYDTLLLNVHTLVLSGTMSFLGMTEEGSRRINITSC